MRTLSHVFFLDPSPVRRVPIQTGIQRKLNFVSVRTIKGRSSFLYISPRRGVDKAEQREDKVPCITPETKRDLQCVKRDLQRVKRDLESVERDLQRVK